MTKPVHRSGMPATYTKITHSWYLVLSAAAPPNHFLLVKLHYLLMMSTLFVLVYTMGWSAHHISPHGSKKVCRKAHFYELNFVVHINNLYYITMSITMYINLMINVCCVRFNLILVYYCLKMSWGSISACVDLLIQKHFACLEFNNKTTIIGLKYSTHSTDPPKWISHSSFKKVMTIKQTVIVMKIAACAYPNCVCLVCF